MSHEEHQNAAHGSHGSGYGGAPKGYAVQHSPADENKRGREEGETLHYTLYTVFARAGQRAESASSAEAIAEFEQLIEELKADGVTLRGLYDVSAMRDNADVMVWTMGRLPKSCRQPCARFAVPRSSARPPSFGRLWACTARQNSPATMHPPMRARRHPRHGYVCTPSCVPTTGTT